MLSLFKISKVTDQAKAEKRILLIDDNEDDCLLIRKAFERAGLSYRIQSVRSGVDGIAYLSGGPPYEDRKKYPLPVLVLLDIRMPTIDGFEVLRWIRKQPALAKLCVVMLTSSDEIPDVNLSHQLGASAFLVKPLDFWNAGELSRSLDLVLAKAGEASNS